ncbi:hypothetical protein [Microbaculum sp. FT89]|uniref:hypothetical protein n=1 Tax=Microbaculum sp. FT89 TaxID=3447298 RepID=UPI003F52DA81
MRLFDPREVAHHTGVSAASLRDWRFRGLLEEIGQLRPNGRWGYGYGDIAALAIAHLLASSRLVADLDFAIKLGRYATQFVWAHLKGDDDLTDLDRRYRDLPFIAAWPMGKDLQIELFEKLENATQYSVPGWIALDCRQVAEALRPRLSLLVELSRLDRDGKEGASKR